MANVVYAGLSDQGLVREKNEDQWAADPANGVFIVSDGMGGEFAGDIASRIVVQTLPYMLKEKMRKIKNPTMSDTSENLSDSLRDLSNHVRNKTKNVPGLSGMGATVVVAWIRLPHIMIGHMGDSRAYRMRGENFDQMTVDHSIVQLLIDEGEISTQEAEGHPAAGQLTRFVGMEGEPLPEVESYDLNAEDTYLLCSDGLTGMLTDDAIFSILKRKDSAKETCQELIGSANASGGRDNITALVIKNGGPSAGSYERPESLMENFNE